MDTHDMMRIRRSHRAHTVTSPVEWRGGLATGKEPRDRKGPTLRGRRLVATIADPFSVCRRSLRCRCPVLLRGCWGSAQTCEWRRSVRTPGASVDEERLDRGDGHACDQREEAVEKGPAGGVPRPALEEDLGGDGGGDGETG